MQRPLESGHLLFHGTYRIEGELGAGGFGIAYRAVAVSLGMPVVVKEFFPLHCKRVSGQVMADGRDWKPEEYEQARLRAADEGRTLARLNHPGIVRVLNAFEENGTFYLVMEFVEGQTLEDYLEERGRLPLEEAVGMVRQIGAALRVVHGANLLHRDLKPSNILRRADGSPALIDFGAAREFTPGRVLTMTNIRSQGYSPPEQYTGKGVWDATLDIYALSATLYTLLTGLIPQEATMRRLEDHVQPLKALRSDAPEALSELVSRGMALGPADRPKDVDAFLTVLKTATAPTLIVPALPVAQPTAPPPNPPVVSVPEATPIRSCINPKDGAEMLFVPGGMFTMGDTDRKDNLPHQVTLSSYYIYKNLVTVAQYEKFCAVTGRQMPPEPVVILKEKHFNPGWQKKDHPIVNVSWEDAQAYCQWAGVRLPTEAEWEVAARGTDECKYPWGNEFDTSRLQCSKLMDNDSGGTAPVGSFPLGASPYGALDMAGNVWEWCMDWYDENYWKPGVSYDNPVKLINDEKRVLRGGCWGNSSPVSFRASIRHCSDPDNRMYYFGFRCVGQGPAQPVQFSGQPSVAQLTTPPSNPPVASAAGLVPECSRINPIDGAEMLWIPGGTFTLGGREAMNTALHNATLSGYWIYKYPVTVAQYRKFCESHTSKVFGLPFRGKRCHPRRPGAGRRIIRWLM